MNISTLLLQYYFMLDSSKLFVDNNEVGTVAVPILMVFIDK